MVLWMRVQSLGLTRDSQAEATVAFHAAPRADGMMTIIVMLLHSDQTSFQAHSSQVDMESGTPLIWNIYRLTPALLSSRSQFRVCSLLNVSSAPWVYTPRPGKSLPC